MIRRYKLTNQTIPRIIKKVCGVCKKGFKLDDEIITKPTTGGRRGSYHIKCARRKKIID